MHEEPTDGTKAVTEDNQEEPVDSTSVSTKAPLWSPPSRVPSLFTIVL